MTIPSAHSVGRSSFSIADLLVKSKFSTRDRCLRRYSEVQSTLEGSSRARTSIWCDGFVARRSVPACMVEKRGVAAVAFQSDICSNS